MIPGPPRIINAQQNTLHQLRCTGTHHEQKGQQFFPTKVFC